MKSQFLLAVVLSVVVGLLAAPRCSAQVRGTVEFSPIVGVYLPSSQLPDVPPAWVCPRGVPCPYEVPSPVARDQHSAVAFGGRVTGWVNQRIAVEGSVWYSPSPVTGPTGDPAGIMAGNVRVLVRTGGAGTWAYLVGGPAFVGRLGDAYGAGTGTGRLGGVVGVGAHLRVARALALRAEVEDYLYSVQGYHQHDFSLSVGLSVASRIGGAATP